MSLLRRIRPSTIPANIDPQNETLVLRERILQRILLGLCILGTAAYIPNLITPIQKGQWILVTIYTVVYISALVITFYRNIPYSLRSGVVLSIFFLLGITGLLESGLSGDGRVFLIVFPIMTFILIGVRSGILASGLSFLGLITVGFLMVSGWVPLPPVEVMANSGKPLDWTTGALVFLLLMVASDSSLHSLISGMDLIRQRQKELTLELSKERDSLEKRVEERTKLLERRATELEAASRIASQITRTTDPQKLLDNAAELIRQQFSFYHVGIFLTDEKGEYAVLRSATGEAGKLMLASGHQLRVSDVSIVSYVISKGESRNSSNVDEDPWHYKNPILPYTRSEMALPLRIGNRVIGVLDVQSERVNSFTSDDATILQTIADQLAVAIENANLVQQLKQSLAELETSYQEFTRKAWESYIQSAPKKYSYRLRRESAARQDIWLEDESPLYPEMIQALESERTVMTSTQSTNQPGKPQNVVAIPIKLREQVLGVLDVRFDSTAIPQDTVSLLETATNRLALALENARLLETIQLRAEREHLVSDISARIRATSEIDDILRTAVSELGRSLGVSEVIIQLRSEK